MRGSRRWGASRISPSAKSAAARARAHGGVYEMFRRCALAVLSLGPANPTTRARSSTATRISTSASCRQAWGVKLEMRERAGQRLRRRPMIRGIKEHLFAVLRDIVYIHDADLEHAPLRPERSGERSPTRCSTSCATRACSTTAASPNLVVCWGGHSIGATEYDYTKRVGYELGLRGLDICTGCGPGAMKGPMKGATIAHAKQRIRDGRYIGITEPGIIAAESPNPIVNQLVIMPDIEKRLEAFVRMRARHHRVPGRRRHGRGDPVSARHPARSGQRGQPFPLVFTGPPVGAEYFEPDRPVHLASTLGRRRAQKRYRIVDRRSGAGGARGAARHRSGARVPPHTRATHTTSTGCCASRRSSSSRSSRRTRRWRARAAARPAAARAGGEPAPRVLRHRRGQRQGRGHARDRGARAVRDRTATPEMMRRSMRCCRRSSRSSA